MVLKIFLVEDSPLIRDSLIDHIEDLLPAKVVGHAPDELGSVRWLLDHHPWDIAVVDLFLSQGSGLGVIRSLRHRAPAQKAVVLTNYATPDIRERCLKLGADAVYDKSQEIEELAEFVIQCEQERRGAMG